MSAESYLGAEVPGAVDLIEAGYRTTLRGHDAVCDLQDQWRAVWLSKLSFREVRLTTDSEPGVDAEVDYLTPEGELVIVTVEGNSHKEALLRCALEHPSVAELVIDVAADLARILVPDSPPSTSTEGRGAE